MLGLGLLTGLEVLGEVAAASVAVVAAATRAVAVAVAAAPAPAAAPAVGSWGVWDGVGFFGEGLE